MFAIRFNANYLGLVPVGALSVNPIAPGERGTFSLALADDGPSADALGVRIAVKTELGVVYFTVSTARLGSLHTCCTRKRVVFSKGRSKFIVGRTVSEPSDITRLCVKSNDPEWTDIVMVF